MSHISLLTALVILPLQSKKSNCRSPASPQTGAKTPQRCNLLVIEDIVVGTSCNAQFLVCCDDSYSNGRIGSGDNALSASLVVNFLIKYDAHMLEARADLLTQDIGVFTDAAGKYQLIKAAQLSIVRADVTDDGGGENIKSKLSTLITSQSTGAEESPVSGNSGSGVSSGAGVAVGSGVDSGVGGSGISSKIAFTSTLLSPIVN